MDDRDRGIVTCPRCGAHVAEDMAGECCARLEEAAPELRDALRALVAAVDGMAVVWKDDEADLAPALAAAREALDHAEGRGE